jgi:S1-C subfamily serine protease
MSIFIKILFVLSFLCCEKPVINNYGEMLDPIVGVWSVDRSGSGVLIYKNISKKDDDVFSYLVVTNYHVISNRKIKKIISVDGLRGKSWFKIKDRGCQVFVFNKNGAGNKRYSGKIIAESKEIDIAIIYFETEDDLNIAILPTTEMIEDVDRLDDVYSVGCQLSQRPTITKGIISRIDISGENNQYTEFISDAHIYLGSSGGGLFKLYDNHYYLIGISYKVGINGRNLLPHIAYSISWQVIIDFLLKNDMEHVVIGASIQ